MRVKYAEVTCSALRVVVCSAQRRSTSKCCVGPSRSPSRSARQAQEKAKAGVGSVSVSVERHNADQPDECALLLCAAAAAAAARRRSDEVPSESSRA